MGDWNGQTIGGYQLAEEIGQGGAAVVYRAYQPQLERWVAIKLLEIKESGGRQFLRRFRRETRAVAALEHPNILSIHDYGEDQGCAYIVMGYVEGGALTKRMAEAPLSCLEALSLIVPVSEALAYAHSKQIVHRDVKPSNILLIRPDWPLLVDFGLAEVVGRHGAEQLDATPATSIYLSPEQVSGKDVDHRTDIYSLAMILYELLTGSLPFKAESPTDSLLIRLQEPPIPPCDRNPDLPKSLQTVLLRALERDKDTRYSDMDVLVNDLKRVQLYMQQTPTSVKEPKTTPMITKHIGVQPALQGPQLFIATSGVALSLPNFDEVLIGRRDPMTSTLPDLDMDPFGGGSAGVSRRHARFLHREEGWFLEDLQSTNGTYVNEVRLLPNRPVRLRSGDLVRFGQMTLVFEA